ncbi:MAG: sensor histidine kinase, partial [Candidatus Sericytochromatia bacterium]
MGEHASTDPTHPAHAGDAPTGDVGIRVTSYQPTSAESELVSLRREVARLAERNAVLEAQQLELEHLQQLDKLKDQFLSILSHELRTPINAIMGFGSVLDDEVAGSLTAQQHQYVQKMLKGADVLLALVNDLLDMSRIQAGKFSLSPQPIDFAQVAGETLESLGPLAEQRAIRLERELPGDLPPLRADPQR